MLEFIVTLPTYDQDQATKRVWAWLENAFQGAEGVCYYKHPVLMTASGVTPELTLITTSFQPIILRCLPYRLEDITLVEDEVWKVNGEEVDSPLLEVDDFAVVLASKFDKDRILRKRLDPVRAAALPLVPRQDFLAEYHALPTGSDIVFSDANLDSIVRPLDKPLSPLEWRHARSIVQGISPLTRGTGQIPAKATTLGDAIKYIDRYIALLDEEQAKAALQIAPGPQRIRGLAGTGKTVLLAMKAANVHLRFKDSKILFTFNTQSLYNQTRALISRFYRFNSDEDPDWDRLHIRHAWGGASRPGVYYDVCARLGVAPLNLNQARSINRRNPFLACCEHALAHKFDPQYDFIMVDEAQDFPPAFFKMLYRLSNPPRQLYWVCDELQSLFAERLPTPEEQFGYDENGKPLVVLAGDPYPGGIEKDLVLLKSYRCPQPVLMLAHAIGLGLYNPDGCVQILKTKASWEALGYTIEQGDLVEGEETVIYRDPENSPTPITTLYQGPQPLVIAESFQSRAEEYQWIAKSIQNDINVERVPPENIIVVCLDTLRMRDLLPPLQRSLNDLSVPSTIPGLLDDSATFAEPGHVTLSTVFRAKGNESFIVYIFSFEALCDYVESLQNRNRAFTSISRSKAWVRITGVGDGMEKAKAEIDRILADIPRFRFTYPDPDQIPSLDAETDRRRREMRKARESITGLVGLDARAIEALASQEPDLFNQLVERISEAKRREDK